MVKPDSTPFPPFSFPLLWSLKDVTVRLGYGIWKLTIGQLLPSDGESPTSHFEEIARVTVWWEGDNDPLLGGSTAYCADKVGQVAVARYEQSRVKSIFIGVGQHFDGNVYIGFLFLMVYPTSTALEAFHRLLKIVAIKYLDPLKGANSFQICILTSAFIRVARRLRYKRGEILDDC